MEEVAIERFAHVIGIPEARLADAFPTAGMARPFSEGFIYLREGPRVGEGPAKSILLNSRTSSVTCPAASKIFAKWIHCRAQSKKWSLIRGSAVLAATAAQ
jgi:hypothetical protein